MTVDARERFTPPVVDEPGVLNAGAEAGVACGDFIAADVQPTEDCGGLISRLDTLVGPAAEPENSVLTDGARLVRWTGPVFGLFALILLPWTVYLAVSLPSRQVSANYDVAWAGFDVMLLLALAATAYFALRRSRYLAIAATAAATLLMVDAWFDVLTTPSGQRLQSILLAIAVELPLASVCLWLSHHTQQLAERRIVVLLRRQRHKSRHSPRTTINLERR